MENQLYPSGLNAAKSGNHTGFHNKEDSYTKVKEYFENINPTPEECGAFLDYLMSDDRHWESVERIFNETIEEDAKSSAESGIPFLIFSGAKNGSRTNLKKFTIKKSLKINSLRFRKKKSARPD